MIRPHSRTLRRMETTTTQVREAVRAYRCVGSGRSVAASLAARRGPVEPSRKVQPKIPSTTTPSAAATTPVCLSTVFLFTLALHIAQSRSCVYIFRPRVGHIYVLGAVGFRDWMYLGTVKCTGCVSWLILCGIMIGSSRELKLCGVCTKLCPQGPGTWLLRAYVLKPIIARSISLSLSLSLSLYLSVSLYLSLSLSLALSLCFSLSISLSISVSLSLSLSLYISLSAYMYI